MKEHLNHWLTEKMKVAGVLACGIRGPDRKTFTRSQSTQFTSAGMENACRCLADTFQILNTNHFPCSLIRWVYENYYVYGSIRYDGICLAILTRREAPNLQPVDLEGILVEFQSLHS